MLESTVERHLREEAKKRKGMALKFVSPGMNGVPDRIVLMPDGKMAFVDLSCHQLSVRSCNIGSALVFCGYRLCFGERYTCKRLQLS